MGISLYRLSIIINPDRGDGCWQGKEGRESRVEDNEINDKDRVDRVISLYVERYWLIIADESALMI